MLQTFLFPHLLLDGLDNSFQFKDGTLNVNQLLLDVLAAHFNGYLFSLANLLIDIPTACLHLRKFQVLRGGGLLYFRNDRLPFQCLRFRLIVSRLQLRQFIIQSHQYLRLNFRQVMLHVRKLLKHRVYDTRNRSEISDRRRINKSYLNDSGN